ncbi:hypothetical protein Bca4012_082910 [Brassica carinata]
MVVAGERRDDYSGGGDGDAAAKFMEGEIWRRLAVAGGRRDDYGGGSGDGDEAVRFMEGEIWRRLAVAGGRRDDYGGGGDGDAAARFMEGEIWRRSNTSLDVSSSNGLYALRKRFTARNVAFKGKDFVTTIECYTQDGTMVSPTVFARRCLCYLMSNMPQEALGDAMQAQVVSPEWPTAFNLQAAALFSLGMDKDACETLKDGTSLEAKKQNNRN